MAVGYFPDSAINIILHELEKQFKFANEFGNIPTPDVGYAASLSYNYDCSPILGTARGTDRICNLRGPPSRATSFTHPGFVNAVHTCVMTARDKWLATTHPSSLGKPFAEMSADARLYEVKSNLHITITGEKRFCPPMQATVVDILPLRRQCP